MFRGQPPRHFMSNLPQSVTMYIRCEPPGSDSGFRARHITCFRCGEIGHYRSECHTFKVTPCEKYESGVCPLAATQCPFAHGEELRKPWLSKCVRVVKNGGRVDVLGCGQIGHTFRTCPNDAFAQCQPCQSVEIVHSLSTSKRTL